MGNSLEGFTGVVEGPIVNEPVKDKTTERGNMMATNKYNVHRPVSFAVSSMQGWRATMEDTHILEASLKVKEELHDHAFFAVYDGHGGYFTSQYVSENFSRILTQRSEWKKYTKLSTAARAEVPGIQLVKDAMKNAYTDMDNELEKIYVDRLSKIDLNSVRRRSRRSVQATRDECRDESDPAEVEKPVLQKLMLDRSGTTAVSVLLTPTHIICSNAGDSRAILCREGMALPLSFDHKPVNPTEICRVNAAGGFVKMKRIDGDLAVSRGFGDFRYKLNSDTTFDKQKVVAVPEIIVYPRVDEKDEFLVLGCDGIWDVVDNPTCATMVKEKLKEGKTDLGQICEEILDDCLLKESKDNMTVCVVALPGCEFKETSTSSTRGMFSSLI
jgi:protein phosphatase 1B